MKLRCIVGVAALLLCAAPAAADLISADPPFYDVDKINAGTGGVDSDLCWAAAAANILMATDWGVDYDGDGIVEEDEDIYEELRAHFPNVGGWGHWAFEYYIETHYPHLLWTDYVRDVWRDHEVLQAMADTYQRGWPVFMQIKGVHDDGWDLNHAITGWAIDLDPDGTGSIFVTDSDDGYWQNVFGLQEFDLYSEGTGTGRQWFMRLPGIDHTLIARVQILYPETPEPDVMALLLAAFAVLVVLRRR